MAKKEIIAHEGNPKNNKDKIKEEPKKKMKKENLIKETSPNNINIVTKFRIANKLMKIKLMKKNKIEEAKMKIKTLK